MPVGGGLKHANVCGAQTELRQARRERDELQAQHVQTLNERDTLKRSAAELRQKQSEVEVSQKYRIGA